MKTYTPAELRALADSRHANPFFADQARAAMHYAANVLGAADAAVTAERQRAEQGDAKDARRAAIQQAAGAVPEGWKLVPVEPTEAMMAGLSGESDAWLMDGFRADYARMLAASPAPPKQQPDHLASGECGGVTQWLPIETAPKASKAILVHCADRKNTYTATWARDEEFPWSGKWKHFGGGFFDEVPTHWMPTPPAPTGQINPDSAGQGMEADHG